MVDAAGGTRDRIQAVALQLFVEQGYEKTSMREIAERLGVTKAALYYHFQSKQEILDSVNGLIRERLGRLDAVISWASGQPRTLLTRQELILKYASELFGESGDVLRFVERNQASLRELSAVSDLRDRLATLTGFLTDPDASPTSRIRTAMALYALHTGYLVVDDPDLTEEQRIGAGIQVALDLLQEPED